MLCYSITIALLQHLGNTLWKHAGILSTLINVADEDCSALIKLSTVKDPMASARPFPRVLRVAHIVALVWAEPANALSRPNRL